MIRTATSSRLTLCALRILGEYTYVACVSGLTRILVRHSSLGEAIAPPMASSSQASEATIQSHDWPFKYTQDMALGLFKLNTLRNGGLGREAAFRDAFPGCRFRSSTYGDQLSYWNAHSDAERLAMRVKRRNEHGKWSQVQQEGKKRLAAGRLTKIKTEQ